ncbi:unnamed protein product [Effrenium voratum]|nr:unnamed protein product [Effrenium voratum]
MELLEQGRRLLRALDASLGTTMGVCLWKNESAWLFPDEGSFQAVLDPLDCNLVDADLLWSLISDRLERDSEAGREWLQSQWRHLRLRRAPTAGDFSPVCSRSIGLTRTYTKLPTSPGSIGRAWQGFCDALPLDEILSAFKSLSGHLRAGSRHLGVYRKLVERIPTLAIPRFQKQLDSGEAPLDLRLALLGAGPIGLRAALELALLGAQVHVFELRNSFSRMNILKLWDWAALELLSLGAKDLLPNFLSYMDHIGIRELQALLLKLCLLAGVSFHWRRGFKEVKPSAAGDAVQLTTYKLTEKKEVGGEEVSTFSTLIACDGGKSKVAESLGLQRVRFDGSEAPPTWEVAVVVNFENHKELEDRLLQESPRGFGEEISLVKRLIYLQGETHYFIMTVDVDVLVEHGVLRTGGDAQSVTADGNLHSQELESFAREVVELYSAEVRRLYKENDGAFGIDIPANFWSERQVAVDPAGRPALSIFPYNADLMCLSQPMHLMDAWSELWEGKKPAD